MLVVTKQAPARVLNEILVRLLVKDAVPTIQEEHLERILTRSIII